jgi:hypothetical protein
MTVVQESEEEFLSQEVGTAINVIAEESPCNSPPAKKSYHYHAGRAERVDSDILGTGDNLAFKLKAAEESEAEAVKANAQYAIPSDHMEVSEDVQSPTMQLKLSQLPDPQKLSLLPPAMDKSDAYRDNTADIMPLPKIEAPTLFPKPVASSSMVPFPTLPVSVYDDTSYSASHSHFTADAHVGESDLDGDRDVHLKSGQLGEIRGQGQWQKQEQEQERELERQSAQFHAMFLPPSPTTPIVSSSKSISSTQDSSKITAMNDTGADANVNIVTPMKPPGSSDYRNHHVSLEPPITAVDAPTPPAAVSTAASAAMVTPQRPTSTVASSQSSPSCYTPLQAAAAMITSTSTLSTPQLTPAASPTDTADAAASVKQASMAVSPSSPVDTCCGVFGSLLPTSLIRNRSHSYPVPSQTSQNSDANSGFGSAAPFTASASASATAMASAAAYSAAQGIGKCPDGSHCDNYNHDSNGPTTQSTSGGTSSINTANTRLFTELGTSASSPLAAAAAAGGGGGENGISSTLNSVNFGLEEGLKEIETRLRYLICGDLRKELGLVLRSNLVAAYLQVNKLFH